MMTKTDDPTHKQKAIYSLTEKAIALVPVFAQLGAWGRRYTAATEELSTRAQLLEEGGPAMWDRFMSELAHTHVGRPSRRKGPLGRRAIAGRIRRPMRSTNEAQEGVNVLESLAYIGNATAGRT